MEEGQEGNSLMEPEGSVGSSGEKQWVKKQGWKKWPVDALDASSSASVQVQNGTGHCSFRVFFPVKVEHPSKIRYSSGLLPEECL